MLVSNFSSLQWSFVRMCACCHEHAHNPQGNVPNEGLFPAEEKYLWWHPQREIKKGGGGFLLILLEARAP